MPWEQALERIKQTASPVFNPSPAVLSVSCKELSDHANSIGQGSIRPMVRLESRGVTELELDWFKSLPHVKELLNELHLRGRKYGVGFSQIILEEGDPKVSFILDLAGCSAEQESAALLVPHLNEALTAVAKASNIAKLRFYLHTFTKGRDMRSLSRQVQSMYDFLASGRSIEARVKMMGGKVIKIEMPWLQLKDHWLEQAGFWIGMAETMRVMEDCLVLTVEPEPANN